MTLVTRAAKAATSSAATAARLASILVASELIDKIHTENLLFIIIILIENENSVPSNGSWYFLDSSNIFC